MQAPARQRGPEYGPIILGIPLPYPLVPPAPPQAPRGSYMLSPVAPDFDCPICLNEINNPENKIITSCNHAFCGDCIEHLQNLAQNNKCIKCPMCRLVLKKKLPPVQEIPLDKIPLVKIRRLLAEQIRSVDSLQFQLQNAPNRIASYTQTIDNIMRSANNAHRQMNSQIKRLQELQEQITRRERPRRQVAEEIFTV